MDIDELDPATRAFEALRQDVRTLEGKIDNLIAATRHVGNTTAATEASLKAIDGHQVDAKAQEAPFAGLVRELLQELQKTQEERFDLQVTKAEILSFRVLTRWIAGAVVLISGAAIATAIVVSL